MTMGRTPRLPLVAIVAAGLLCATATRADVLDDAGLGFKLTLPAGFVDYPAGRAQPGTAYSYIKGKPGTDDYAMIAIKPMGGTIGREPLDSEGLPHADGVHFSLRREKWKSFDIDVMDGVARQGDVGVIVQIAQVPLQGEAIQVAVSGPLAHQAELTALLRTLLASLDGDSNWLTDSERSFSAGKAVGGLAALGLAGWLIWRLRRRQRAANEAR